MFEDAVLIGYIIFVIGFAYYCFVGKWRNRD